MQICRFVRDGQASLGILDGQRVRDLSAWRAGALASVEALLTLPLDQARDLLAAADTADLPSYALGTEAALAAPIDTQEVWACGVTYERSRVARMEEAREKDIYDRVYEADRPEIFFKATARRVVGPGEPVRIRQDSTWDVPEAEAALVINSRMELVGMTIGNDMSSRSIEGENPLYLTQAKVYQASCALGPAIVPVWDLDDINALPIRVQIERGPHTVFDGETSTAQLHRTFDDLIMYLARDQEFPPGVILLTGTGVVPPNEFTLEPGDIVRITIPGIGSLSNPVTRG